MTQENDKSFREVDRTRAFRVKYYATQFAQMYRALAGEQADLQRLAITAANFSVAAGLSGEEHAAFVEAVLNEGNK